MEKIKVAVIGAGLMGNGIAQAWLCDVERFGCLGIMLHLGQLAKIIQLLQIHSASPLCFFSKQNLQAGDTADITVIIHDYQ